MSVTANSLQYRSTIGEDYLDNEKIPIQRMQHFRDRALSYNLTYWHQATIDLQFWAGNQTAIANHYGLGVNQRKSYNFNRIMRVTNMISGHQRRNRKSNIAIPVENSDDHTADQLSKVLNFCDREDSVLDTISNAFEGALITGMNLLHVWVDYRNDPVNGDVRTSNYSYNEFIMDPYWRNPDLSDCNGIYCRNFMTKREAMNLLPWAADEILELPNSRTLDGQFQYMPENYNFNPYNLVAYDQFYYRDYRKQKMIMDVNTGETTEWRSDDKEMLKKFLNSFPELSVIETEIPTVRLTIAVQGKTIFDGPNPTGDSYPFVAVLGYYSPQLPDLEGRLQGVVRGLRDPQFLYNRRKVIELDTLESQLNSGWKYKEDALVDPSHVFFNGQGKGLALKAEASMDDVQQIIPPSIAPTTLQLSEVLAREIQEISGINEELLGSATDEKAGILSMLRQGAGLTTLQGLLDRLDRSQKLVAQRRLECITSNYGPGKIQRILGEQPSPYFYNRQFGRYDVAIEEGLNTTTQKQMQFAQLMQLRELGVNIPDSVLIEACTIQDKKKLTDALDQQQQKQEQIQQMQLQATLEEQKARTELAHSRSIADQGLGVERASRVQENKALAEERRAAAIKDQEAGFLDLVKAIKEIQSLDLAEVRNLLEMHKMMTDNVSNGSLSDESSASEQIVPKVQVPAISKSMKNKPKKI